MGFIKIVSQLFNWTKDVSLLNKEYRGIIKGTKGTKRMLLVELKNNLDLILDHHLNNRIPLKKIVPLLENKELKKLLKKVLILKRLRKGRWAKSIYLRRPITKSI